MIRELVIVVALWMRWDPAAVVAHRAAAALESRDARTLIRLVDTDEIVALGLSEAKVKAWLDGTIWREGSPGTLRSTPALANGARHGADAERPEP